MSDSESNDQPKEPPKKRRRKSSVISRHKKSRSTTKQQEDQRKRYQKRALEEKNTIIQNQRALIEQYEQKVLSMSMEIEKLKQSIDNAPEIANEMEIEIKIPQTVLQVWQQIATHLLINSFCSKMNV